MKWVSLNKPTGKNFIKWGTSRCDVTLEFDKHEVTRSTAKRLNEYKLDGQVLKAFRSDVPDTVSKLLRIQGINFQGQHDSAFWFNLSPGQVTKELNKLVDLQTIDTIQANLSKQLRTAKTLLSDTEERIRTERTAIRDLQWVMRVAVSFRWFPAAFGRIAGNAASVAHIASLAGGGSRQAARRRNAAAATVAGVAVGSVAATAQQAAQRGGRVRRAAAGVLGAHKRRATAAGALAAIEMPDWSHEVNKLKSYMKSRNELSERMCECQTELDEMKQKLGNRCPICGKELND